METRGSCSEDTNAKEDGKEEERQQEDYQNGCNGRLDGYKLLQGVYQAGRSKGERVLIEIDNGFIVHVGYRQ